MFYPHCHLFLPKYISDFSGFLHRKSLKSMHQLSVYYTVVNMELIRVFIFFSASQPFHDHNSCNDLVISNFYWHGNLAETSTKIWCQTHIFQQWIMFRLLSLVAPSIGTRFGDWRFSISNLKLSDVLYRRVTTLLQSSETWRQQHSPAHFKTCNSDKNAGFLKDQAKFHQRKSQW